MNRRRNVPFFAAMQTVTSNARFLFRPFAEDFGLERGEDDYLANGSPRAIPAATNMDENTMSTLRHKTPEKVDMELFKGHLQVWHLVDSREHDDCLDFWPTGYELVAIVDTDCIYEALDWTNSFVWKEWSHPEIQLYEWWRTPPRRSQVGDVFVTPDGVPHILLSDSVAFYTRDQQTVV